MTVGTPRRAALWILVGFGMAQLAWMSALPPFRGADEVDHVFRASAVAHGDWVSEPTAATVGTGAVVSVSTALVEAARPACERLEYKVGDDCGGRDPTSSRTAVPTASGRYNPLYYAAVGYPASLTDGTAAVIVMRLVSATLCLALLGFALTRLACWGGPRRLAAAAIAITPTVVYSTIVVAPNGLEMMAALGFWIALAGLAHDDDPAHQTGHVVLGTVSGALLVTLRSMGPLWALGVLAATMLAWPTLWPRLRAAAKLPVGRAAVVVGAIASAASLTWIMVQRSLVVGREPSGETVTLAFRVVRSLQEVPVWLLQSIAAFPYRNQPAPLVVYPCYLVLIGCLLALGIRGGSTRLRAAVGLTVAACVAVPLAITFATIDIFGTAWQGRYSLPLLLGAAVLAGDGWARGQRSLGRVALAIGLVLFVVVHVSGVLAVGASTDRGDGWRSAAGAVLSHPPVWSVAVLAFAGAGAIYLPVARLLRRQG